MTTRDDDNVAMVGYHVDDVTLRDEPDDRDAAWEYVHSLKPGPEKVLWLRMLGDLYGAEALGWNLLADAGGPESIPAARHHVRLPVDAQRPAIRLAHVLHWQERFRDADVLFEAAIVSASNVAELAGDGSVEERTATTTLAFALQHLGKSRFDEGRLDEALELFQQALDLRRRLGAPDDQITSSQQAITATRARLTGGSQQPSVSE